MLASSTSLSLCQIFCSPLLLPAVKNKAVYVWQTSSQPSRQHSEGDIADFWRWTPVPSAGSADPWMSSAGHSSCPSLSYQGSANEVCTAGFPPQDGGTWALSPEPWSPGQGGHHSSPDQFLHFHSTTRSSSRIPVPKKQRNSLNKWSKHSRLIISCKEQAQESTLAYHHTEIWPTSPACHWQPFFFLPYS